MRVMQSKFTKTNLKFQGGGDVPIQTPFAEEPSVFMQWPSAKDLTALHQEWKSPYKGKILGTWWCYSTINKPTLHEQ